MSLIDKIHIDAFSKLFDHIYKGDQPAKRLSFMLLDVAHTWDDIIDGDPVDSGDVNKAFIACIFEMQRHPLWFSAGLDHHVLNVFLRWRDANTIESDSKSTYEDLSKCYMLRAGLYDLFVIIAYHLLGDDWAAEIGPMVRKFYGETLEEYLQEMKDA